ncbi:hypothetical protein [Naasia sp. SYSU D00948]|uniref:hypothetical protein n=1 Tax=Naasia sp. SYSU D00948 TaxID=2817379 RepID=UPI001B30B7A9|nr:hypothetical protein [Naasia sp. SYSU D00948]
MENNERINPSDDAVREGFDQTNSLAGDQLGESDGTVDGQLQSSADRGGDDDSLLAGDNDADDRGEGNGFLPGNPARGGSGGI